MCHDPYFPCNSTSPVICESAKVYTGIFGGDDNYKLGEPVKVCPGLLGGGDNKDNSEPGPSSNTNKKNVVEDQREKDLEEPLY